MERRKGMDKIYFYLLMTPEALVASMLPPAAFGIYLSVGTRKRSRGQAMYFNLKSDFQSDYFDLSDITKRCLRHPDGQPKRSVYLGIYRVLEHVPLEALDNLYLSTRDGRVLELPQGQMPSESGPAYHLYKDICPVHPLIASSRDPTEFCRFITDPSRAIYVPRICFVEMNLGKLAEEPQTVNGISLPYHHLEHIRDCLLELRDKGKVTKTVDRIEPLEYHYRCIKTGFFVGDRQGLLYFPFPSLSEMESIHHKWWRSADI